MALILLIFFISTVCCAWQWWVWRASARVWKASAKMLVKMIHEKGIFDELLTEAELTKRRRKELRDTFPDCCK